ncbi:MAG: ribonuclease Y [bacterium]|nr:ribonuclease Y [bacterium]
MEYLPILLGGIVLFSLGAILGYFIRQNIAAKQVGSIEARVAKLAQDAKTEAKEILLAAKDKAVKILEEAKKEEKERQIQLSRLEERLVRREEILDKRLVNLENSEKDLAQKIVKVREIKEELEKVKAERLLDLQRIAGLTLEQARGEIFHLAEERYRQDLAQYIAKLESSRREEFEKKAFEIMATAIQRYSRSHIADLVTSVVALPSDEIKGKIIGREGRNIRALERMTGVEIIVDETPEAITVSSFDPIRREIARLALQKLIQDGRIQPARIEEKVEEAKKEISQKIKEAGEAAVYEVEILDLPPEIVHLLGRLAFRTSFGQNVLLHSIEAAHLAGMLARELGCNVAVAKKGALLHDIGKAVDHEIEGTHLELGRKILHKYGVEEKVIKAMEPHHEDYPFETPESFLVAAAEAISAARPGARRDTLENFIKRLENLEKIAGSFPGVEKSYAIQAGRELRVFVIPDQIDDLGALKLARDIANKIETELKYPGEIKVNVIREIRAVEYAR